MDTQLYNDILFYHLNDKKLPPLIAELCESSKTRFRKQAKKYTVVDKQLYTIGPKDDFYKPILTKVIKKPEAQKYIINRFKELPASPIKLFDKGTKITYEQTKNIINRIEPYQLHKAIPKKNESKPIKVGGAGKYLQADLIDMSNNTGPLNHNKKWILTVIDIYSKKAWAVPIAKKKPHYVNPELERIMAESGAEVVHTDRGSEFAKIKDLGKHIKGTSYNPDGQSHIERFNGTIKRYLWRLMTINKTTKWIDLLPQAVNEYNKSIHSAHGLAPNNVQPGDVVEFKESTQKRRYLAELSVGDIVRVSLMTRRKYRKLIKKKSYTTNWSLSLYTIVRKQKVKDKEIYLYILQSPKGHVKTRKFFRNELLKVDPDIIKISAPRRVVAQQPQPPPPADDGFVLPDDDALVGPAAPVAPVAAAPVAPPPRRSTRSTNPLPTDPTRSLYTQMLQITGEEAYGRAENYEQNRN
jgi:hypothetical protein